MTVETFLPRKFHDKTMAVIEQINAVVREYQAKDFQLTVRQVHYQRVARGLSENTPKAYNQLKGLLSAARLAGLVDWEAIEDRTRHVREHSFWKTPAEIIDSAAASYREDLWEGQLYRPQVWIEKDALVGVIEPVCNRWRVPFFPHRGNNSQTLQYQSGKLFAEQLSQGLIPINAFWSGGSPSTWIRSSSTDRRSISPRRTTLASSRIAKPMASIPGSWMLWIRPSSMHLSTTLSPEWSTTTRGMWPRLKKPKSGSFWRQ